MDLRHLTAVCWCRCLRRAASAHACAPSAWRCNRRRGRLVWYISIRAVAAVLRRRALAICSAAKRHFCLALRPCLPTTGTLPALSYGALRASAVAAKRQRYAALIRLRAVLLARSPTDGTDKHLPLGAFWQGVRNMRARALRFCATLCTARCFHAACAALRHADAAKRWHGAQHRLCCAASRGELLTGGVTCAAAACTCLSVRTGC